jgi:hypothetical protein
MEINTNKVVELQASEEGFCIVLAQGYDKITIEGGSHIIINMFKSLQHGSMTSKIKKQLAFGG